LQKGFDFEKTDPRLVLILRVAGVKNADGREGDSEGGSEEL
jgi:hypothetical protein